MMQFFYCEQVSNGTALFSRKESDHALRVLRMRRGDLITFTDGRGMLYKGEITGDEREEMVVRVISGKSGPYPRSYRLHVAISPLKSDERLEWFVEKAVETGVDTIIPLICSRSEKRRVRRERLHGIMVSAMKQSARCMLPALGEPEPFSTFIAGSRSGRRLIATCDESLVRTAITEAFSRGDEITIMIGPEGDFTGEELQSAISEGWQPVHMGSGRLRTETAGITACCSAALANL